MATNTRRQPAPIRLAPIVKSAPALRDVKTMTRADLEAEQTSLEQQLRTVGAGLTVALGERYQAVDSALQKLFQYERQFAHLREG